ncbi:MAG TPA: hypothetical protein DCW29_23820 [Janthinobacterium sp.]|nr:hypothetical protein [Janthinobacterium sp.]
MDSDAERRQFVNELWGRFEELQRWALAHWPDSAHPLSAANFVQARQEILALGRTPRPSGEQPSTPQAEPSAGGAQYIDVDPTPWP